MELEPAGGGEFVELVAQCLADALDAGEFVVRGELDDVAIEIRGRFPRHGGRRGS